MLVKDRMTTNPMTIAPDMPVAEALSFMRQKNVRRFPVLNKRGKLVGIVSEKDLLYASPSPATSLSVYEVGYLLSKLKVEEIMTKKVTTVSPDAPLEEAALDYGRQPDRRAAGDGRQRRWSASSRRPTSSRLSWK